MTSWLKRPNQRRFGNPNGSRTGVVLASVSGGASDEHVVRMACRLLDSSRSTLHMLYVIEVGRDSPVDAEIGFASEEAEETLRDMEQVASDYRCVVEAQLVQSRSAGAAVVRQAVDKDVDAIVIGMPYEEVYGSYSLGEYIPYVLRHAPCRVIVCREPPPEPSEERDSRIRALR